ncbi:hypothetical protein CBS101457_006188 [Exobasidium rhododendri]|nr:hypothetical protein CBS101457_006188 [Exobasidium rhododendri]
MDYGARECIYDGRPSKRRAFQPENGYINNKRERPASATAVPSGMPMYAFQEQKLASSQSLRRFLERMKNNTEAERDGLAPYHRSYPPEVFETFEMIRLELPTSEKTELWQTFFMEEMNWMYLVGDFESLDTWLNSFLERFNKKGEKLKTDDVKVGDATRLSLILATILVSVQVANEGLTKIFFLDSEPSSIAKVQEERTKDSIVQSYEEHVRAMLGLATQYDGSSPDLIRASLIYSIYLRNEGRSGGEEAALLVQSISRMVIRCDLQNDPSPTYLHKERESRRRLFWTYYIFDRICCVTSSSPIKISQAEITTKEPEYEYVCGMMGRRNNGCLIYKARLLRIVEDFLGKIQTGGVSAADIEGYEQYCQDWTRSLPEELQPSLPRLNASQRLIRNFELERRILLLSYYTSLTTMHRLCFFPNKLISIEQMNHSRQVCIESTVSIIKIQESLRMRFVSGHHLRWIYIPLTTLESAITLVLASLMELSIESLGGTSGGGEGGGGEGGIPRSVRHYMHWAYRGRDLLLTIPADFAPAVQALKLVSRVLLKASKIINMNARVDSKMAIKDVLTGEDGRQLVIPLIDHHYKKAEGYGIKATSVISGSAQGTTDTSSTDTPSYPIVKPAVFGNFHPDGYASSYDTYQHTTSSISQVPMLDAQRVLQNDLNNYLKVDGEPTHADVDADFFNDVAAALHPFETLNQSTFIGSFMNQHHVPTDNGQSLDEQMESWLATLQNFA